MPLIKLGNPEYFSILGSGIVSFEGEKSYYSTSSVQGVEIGEPEEIITYENRPSRANMQPIAGSVGFAKMAKTLKVLKIDEQFAEKAILSTGFALIYGNPEKVDPSYLRYFFLSSQFNSEKDRLSTGTTQVAINQKGIEKIEVPLFDLSTQQLIVSEIEKQFSRLDEGLSSLLRIRENLKSYRASLLKFAVEGRLTAEWRIKNLSESSRIIFDGYIQERNNLIKQKLLRKSKEYNFLEKTEPGIIPDNWVWIKFGDVGQNSDSSIVDGPFGSAINVSTDYIDSGVPVLRMINVKPGRLILDNLKFISESKFKNFTRHNILPGDILLSKVGAGIGEACIVPDLFQEGMLSTTGISRIRVGSIVVNKYVLYFLMSKAKYLQTIASASAQPFLNMTTIKGIHFPLPPLPEQHRIVEILEERFSVIDSIEALVNANIRRSENLKQAILKKAFSGELVQESEK